MTDADIRDSIRRDALAEAVTAAEEAHAAITSLYEHAPSREQAIAAVVDHAAAVWTVEVWPEDREERWREVAGIVNARTREQARDIVFELLPPEVRRQAERAVLADLYGPGDDDGS